MIELGHITHPGLTRTHNEDSYRADAGRGLWLVADGLGGPGHGEVASALALDTAMAAIAGGVGMADAFRQAGTAIASYAAEHHASEPTGSTLTALRINTAREYELAWVGDSRAYLWEDGQLVRAAHIAPTGEDSAATDGHAPARRRTTQALGITPVPEIDPLPVTGECLPGMQFLLCSDGLTEELDDPHIAAIVARTDLAAQECVDQLVLAALDAGGHDNITVILVRCA